MKRFFLATVLLLALQQNAAAQTDSVIHDTISHRYERFYYSSWYDTCPLFTDSARGFITTHVYSCFDELIGTQTYTPHPIAVKGLAAMVVRDEDLTPISPAEWMYSPDHGHLPEYLSLWQDSSRSVHPVGDSLRFDTLIPRIISIPLSGVDTSRVASCLLYEIYFHKPVYVDSTFYVCGTGHSNTGVWIDEYNDVFRYYKRLHYTVVTDKERGFTPEDLLPTSYCHSTAPTYYLYPRINVATRVADRGWGPFFAIADFYNLTVESSDTALGSVNGGGRFSDLTDVVISATPEPGYSFRRWNDGNTQNPRTVFLTQDTHFTAYFTDSIPLRLTAQPDMAVHGRVTGSGNYWANDTAILTATPNDNYRFTHWNDGDTANPRAVLVTQDTVFTAYFEWINQHNPEGIAAPDGQVPLFTLTPNPAHNSVTVTINSQLSILNSQFSIALTDAAGRELLTLKVQQPKTTIPLGQYPAGTYFVTLRTPDATSTQRLVIE